MLAVRLVDLARLRVARGELGGSPTWTPYPWFSDVQALVALADGGALIAGGAGLSRVDGELERCTWRDDGEALVDLAHGPRGLLGAGENLCFWPGLGEAARRWSPAALGLRAAPRRVRWHPTQPLAAVADALGQVVIVSLAGDEATLERVVGDVTEVDGLAWDPSGHALALAGARDERAVVWLWSVEEGLRERPPLPVGEDDDALRCAVAFAPETGALHVFHGQRLVVADGGAWRTAVDLAGRWPGSGRALEFTADGRAIGSALEGLQIFDLAAPGTATWYRPASVSVRAGLESPCCSAAGGRLLLGTAEGLLVARDPSGRERSCRGVPRPDATGGQVSLAPDGSAVALGDGHDRISVWHLTRATAPVKVRSWEAVHVEASWHRSSAGLRIRGVEVRRTTRLGDWWRLDRGEEEGEGDEDRGAPDSEFVAPGPFSRAHAGWTVSVGEPPELRGPAGERVSVPIGPLQRVHDVAFTPDGELVIVGASTP